MEDLEPLLLTNHYKMKK